MVDQVGHVGRDVGEAVARCRDGGPAEAGGQAADGGVAAGDNLVGGEVEAQRAVFGQRFGAGVACGVGQNDQPLAHRAELRHPRDGAGDRCGSDVEDAEGIEDEGIVAVGDVREITGVQRGRGKCRQRQAGAD